MSKTAAARQPKGKKPAGKGKAKVAESWAGGVAKQILGPRDGKPYKRIDRRLIGRPQLQEAPFDGPNSSKLAPPPVPPQHDSRYPVLPPTEAYPYWGALPASSNPFPIANGGRFPVPSAYPRPGHPRFGLRDTKFAPPPRPYEIQRQRDTAIPRRPVGATYRSRVSQRPGAATNAPTSPQRIRDFSSATTSKKEKRLGMADPVVWESVTRTLSQQHHLSALMTPERSPEPQSDGFRAPSTPSSQRKKLDRFAKDLEIYANVTGAFGKLPQVSSAATESHNTLHTVQELLPYHDQFRAAGLAVTSAEQSAVPKDQGLQKPRLPPSIGFQVDGRRSVERQEDIANQGDSSSSTEIRFAKHEGLSHLLVDELPTPKSKGMSPQKGLPWIHKKQLSNPPRLPQVKEDDPFPPKVACPTTPSRPPPATPKTSATQSGRHSCST